ncbi:hypothetical protein GYA27_01805 [candidate division WWE3 bacterium]|uniref:Uncharacterized protein n=1 Tax=candidate division WWE3 bacterium TaxID=2053526 RepID=A0A7X9DKR6_UNCKA|nr:hypothetical protein [candidate division WWE3 bacterium]
MKTNIITKGILGLILGFLAFLIVLEFKQQPNFIYKITTYEITQDMKELPVEIVPAPDAKGFNFKVIFTDDRDNSEHAKLSLQNKFVNSPPFLTYGEALTVQLVNEDQLSGEDQVIYEVTGSITGLKPGQYKLRIVDPNSNLVDERVVTVE